MANVTISQYDAGSFISGDIVLDPADGVTPWRVAIDDAAGKRLTPLPPSSVVGGQLMDGAFDASGAAWPVGADAANDWVYVAIGGTIGGDSPVAGEKWLFDGVTTWTKFEDVPGAGVGDGGKGEITITGGVWTVDDNVIDAANLQTDSVTTAKILNAAVTNEKLDAIITPRSVTNANITVNAEGRITDATSGGGGSSRKDGLEALGDVSGAVVVDFTAGASDNKQFQVIGNVTSWTLTFGGEGVYNMFITVGTQGFDIPKPTEVKGDWLLVDTTGLTNHIQLMWDGVNARISGVITTDA